MQADDNFIDQKIAEAFGYGDQQLAEELDRADHQPPGQKICGETQEKPDEEDGEDADSGCSFGCNDGWREQLGWGEEVLYV